MKNLYRAILLEKETYSVIWVSYFILNEAAVILLTIQFHFQCISFYLYKLIVANSSYKP